MRKKDFSPENLNLSINMLIYGTKLLKLNKKCTKLKDVILYIEENDIEKLNWIYFKKKKKHFLKGQVNLNEIDLISIKASKANSLKKLKKSCILSLTINEKELVLMLKSENQRNLIWQGVQYFITLIKYKSGG